MTTTSETMQVSTIARTWADYLATRAESLRNALIVHYQFVVRSVAMRIARKLPQQVDVDDLIQCGSLGLRDAIQSFDATRKVKFETYCIRRIRGAIFDGLRTLTWAPRDIRRIAAEIRKATEEAQMELGRAPTAEEVSRRMGVSVEQYQHMAQQAAKITLLSINHKMPGLTRPVELEDRGQALPEEIAQRRDIRDLLTHQLSRNERMVLILYYYEHLTMREIGAVLGITESRVSQMHTQVLALLKQRFEQRLNATAGSHGISVNL